MKGKGTFSSVAILNSCKNYDDNDQVLLPSLRPPCSCWERRRARPRPLVWWAPPARGRGPRTPRWPRWRPWGGMARRSQRTWPSQACPELGHPITPLTCCCHSCSLLGLWPSPSLSSHTNNQLVVVPPPGRALPTNIWQLLTAVQGIPDQVRQILRQPLETFLLAHLSDVLPIIVLKWRQASTFCYCYWLS